jgi:7-keto-8-aminopelargonate synthetase-like enzyme
MHSTGVPPMKMAVETDAIPITKENGSRQNEMRRRTNRFSAWEVLFGGQSIHGHGNPYL